jgi:hypothetical protein
MEPTSLLRKGSVLYNGKAVDYYFSATKNCLDMTSCRRFQEEFGHVTDIYTLDY